MRKLKLFPFFLLLVLLANAQESIRFQIIGKGTCLVRGKTEFYDGEYDRKETLNGRGSFSSNERIELYTGEKHHSDGRADYTFEVVETIADENGYLIFNVKEIITSTYSQDTVI